ncbi:hypothetical protein DI270_001330 [Microbispora triticiradicis]|uniref:Uncharacterized protein n=4 Tax=Microbispora TaxID=2005 RepID=A0ABY3LP54_9ACTN|nr:MULTISPECIES: hypothetical protein [Microbispora]TYB45853.1 hypothetical protein FXF59_31505 [Microbispora tritici]GLW22363.1 hypothetical protein Mame01_24060 [Microbispora amethystogenes]RGA06780.1 hypothetical protein DI270_001380 [Microbispora triticiradicis]RGA06823.1 hypothetical protein DI270_001330 [Microbispora triticiradicis]TLP55133.1 hypothetical protein FED44_25720 [Microbispora fusca]
MPAMRFPSPLGLAVLAAIGLSAVQPAPRAFADTVVPVGHTGSGFHHQVSGQGCDGPYQAQWQYQSQASSSLGTGPAAFPTAIVEIDDD